MTEALNKKFAFSAIHALLKGHDETLVKYGLDSVAGWNSSASAGGFNGTVTILAADVPALLNGQFYMNVHTATNGGGEIRGNLVQVPEPTVSLMGAAATLGLLTLRRRR